MGNKKRTEVERAVIYAGVMGGFSLEKVNELLAAMKSRPLPATSYEWVRRSYVPYFLGDLKRLGAAIEHPPTAAQIKDALVPIEDSDDDI